MKLAWRLNEKPGEIKYFLTHEFETIMDSEYLAFPAFLDIELLKVLCKVLQEDKRIRVFYGEPVIGETLAIDHRHHNGRFDLDSNSDVQEGYLKCTIWKNVKLRLKDSGFSIPDDIQAYYPVLKTSNSPISRCYDFRPEEIVRVEYSNKKDGGILWQHSCFHEWCGYGESDNYPNISHKTEEINSI